VADGWFRKRFKRGEVEALIPDIPEGMWQKCPSCGEVQYAAELQRNLKVCKKCAYHFRLTAAERLEMFVDDPEAFEHWDDHLVTENPLEFPAYLEKLEGHRRKTGLSEAVVTGRAAINGIPVAFGVTDPHFKMGTMNSVVGERIARCVERAHDEEIPLVLVCGSGGGARMEEGILSLMQMAKTAAALGRFRQARRLYVSILTDPSMGGTLASWASLGDLIFAEPGAMIGFAGQRVSQQVQSAKPPANFQTSEFQLEHGHVDAVVHRRDLRETVARTLEWAS
jgi:acetyl-CoA carboxylase carboxyl transferase subunit beta